jgi:acetyl esterase/lipase
MCRIGPVFANNVARISNRWRRPAMPEDVRVVAKRDVVYADGARPLRWNIFYPAAAACKAPAVLLYHGGGWRVGDRATMTAACTLFAELGYVAIAPEYRLLGEAPWPAPLTDARTAIRATRANAESLGISPDQIFLTGYSAGAHLALIAASGSAGPADAEEPYADQSEAVAGVAAFFTPARIEAQVGAMLGISDPAMLAALSPITHAGHYPPTILFCGDADVLTPPELSTVLYRAIREAGGVADLRLYSNLIHEFVSLPGMMQTTIGDAAAFFARTVLDKPAFDAALGELHKWWENITARPEA